MGCGTSRDATATETVGIIETVQPVEVKAVEAVETTGEAMDERDVNDVSTTPEREVSDDDDAMVMNERSHESVKPSVTLETSVGEDLGVHSAREIEEAGQRADAFEASSERTETTERAAVPLVREPTAMRASSVMKDEISTREAALMARLDALESLTAAARTKCRMYDLLEAECTTMREVMDEVKRDARMFCSECEAEAEEFTERARAAVAEARSALREQTKRYELAMEDFERQTRHRVAMATLRSKSDAARARLRASEAIEECESYRKEIERLHSELEAARDEISAVTLAVQPSVKRVDKDDDVSTVSDFGRCSGMRWQLWALRLIRESEKSVVREAEESLIELGHLRVEVAELRRLSEDDLTFDEISALLIDSAEHSGLKHSLRDEPEPYDFYDSRFIL
jgi:hypothetical protein